MHFLFLWLALGISTASHSARYTANASPTTNSKGYLSTRGDTNAQLRCRRLLARNIASPPPGISGSRTHPLRKVLRPRADTPFPLEPVIPRQSSSAGPIPSSSASAPFTDEETLRLFDDFASVQSDSTDDSLSPEEMLEFDRYLLETVGMPGMNAFPAFWQGVLPEMRPGAPSLHDSGDIEICGELSTTAPTGVISSNDMFLLAGSYSLVFYVRTSSPTASLMLLSHDPDLQEIYSTSLEHPGWRASPIFSVEDEGWRLFAVILGQEPAEVMFYIATQ
ncbi:hypothetical protein MMC11_007737 [Xylographa trunciseda]|nr:hypothetical protein [Xylographa trunciseda]